MLSLLLIVLTLSLTCGLPSKETDKVEYEAPDVNDIHYLLYTRDNGVDGSEVLLTEESIKNSDFNAKRQETIFIVHGFGDSGHGIGPQTTKGVFLLHHDQNIIVVDWGKLTTSPFYEASMRNAKIVSNRTSDLIHLLEIHAGLDPATVILNGMSMGGQVLGQIGGYYQKTYGKTVGKILALDPAGVGYHNVGLEDRLDESDADMVVVIHSNSGTLLEGCVGFFGPVGHVDFYPHGGKHQPGCDDTGSFIDLIFGCSHIRSAHFFVESVNSTESTFLSTQCGSWEEYTAGTCEGNDQVSMGYYTPNAARGTFFLDVNAKEPYSQ